MYFEIKTSAIFNCSLERAFQAPMLSDVSKVHTGYGLMPKITHVADDENWGQIGSTKKVYAVNTFIQKGGFVSMDKVIERIENERWNIEVYDFQSWMLGYYKFSGEWKTKELESNKIRIDYKYQLHYKGIMFYPLAWMFAHLFWKKYMKQVLENVRNLAYSNDPFMYK